MSARGIRLEVRLREGARAVGVGSAAVGLDLTSKRILRELAARRVHTDLVEGLRGFARKAELVEQYPAERERGERSAWISRMVAEDLAQNLHGALRLASRTSGIDLGEELLDARRERPNRSRRGGHGRRLRRRFRRSRWPLRIGRRRHLAHQEWGKPAAFSCQEALLPDAPVDLDDAGLDRHAD